MQNDARAAQRALWRAEGWYPDFGVGGAMARAATVVPDARFVFATKESQDEVDRRTLHDRARRVASGLLASGLRAGDRVVLKAPASVDSTVAVEALWLVGAALVPVVPFATDEETADIVRRSGAVRVLAPNEVLSLEQHPPLDELPVVDPADVACIIYTSGSTAAPKGVMHSHETLLAGFPAPDTDAPGGMTLSTFPAGHIASVLGLLRPLACGGSTVIMDRWSPSLAAALIEQHNAMSSAGTPFYLSTLLDEAERSGRDISSLKLFLVGAASVPPALVERAAQAGIVSWRTYGSTEHPAISSGMPTDSTEQRTRTDGKVGPGNEVRVVDEDGNDLPLGQDGEILARGPKQFVGYTDPALDVEAFTGDSWFRTGDVGRIDEDGHLTITDRKKDIIIRGGENISAKEVEDALAIHPAVAEAAVCAAPDDLWGESVHAFVIVREGASLDLDAARAHVADAGLAAHKAPAGLTIVDDLPRTAAGKVRKVALREVLRSCSP